MRAVMSLALPAAAQTYPTHNITAIIPFAAGSAPNATTPSSKAASLFAETLIVSSL